MIIEDSPTIAQYATLLLTQAGYQVFTARGWADANPVVFKEKPNLMLVDVNLGFTMTGDKIAETYKNQRNKFNGEGFLDKVGIYLFSNIDEIKLQDLVKESGIDGYIPKKKGLPGLVKRVQMFFGEN